MHDPLGDLDPTGPGGPIQEGRLGGLGRLFRRRRQHDEVLGGVEGISTPEPSTSRPSSSSPQDPPGTDGPQSRTATPQQPSRVPIIILSGLILIGGIVFAVLGAVFADTSDESSDALRGGDASASVTAPQVTTVDRGAPSVPAEPAAPVTDLFADATPALVAWHGLLGTPIATKQMVLYPDYAFITAESDGALDRYQFRNGAVDPPTDVSVSPADDLGREVFSSDLVDAAIVARLVERAPADTGSPDGEVTHVIIESDLPFADEIVIRVYVDGGRIDATLDGRIQEVFPSS